MNVERANGAPYIATQSIRLLTDTEQPQRYLRAEYFRAGRAAGPSIGPEDAGVWVEVNRWDLARNRVQNPDDSPCDLSRLVITTDAGVGKTTTMDWLHSVLNHTAGTKTTRRRAALGMSRF